MFDRIYSFLASHFIGDAFFLLIGFAVLFFAVRQSLSYIKKHVQNEWLSSLSRAIFPHLWLIVAVYGLCTFFEILLRDQIVWRDKIVTGRYFFIVVMFTILLFRWKSLIEEIFVQRVLRYSKNKKNDRIVIAAVSKIISILIIVFSFMMILDVLGVPIQGLFVFGGISGIAISWAAKDVVANFFGGLMIYINSPFVIGDWIRSPNKNFEGTVEDIGMYMTSICTFDKRPMYIPNALMTDAIVENPGRMYNRRIKTTITLRYEDIKVVEKIIKEIDGMLRSHSGIDQNQILMVHLVSLDTYFFGVNIYTFTKTTVWDEYRSVQQDVLLKIAAIVEANGAEITVPISNIEVDEGVLSDK